MLFLLLHPLFSALSRQLLLLPLLAHTSNSLTEVAHYLLQRKVHKVATKNAHRLPTFNVQRSPLVFTGIAHTPRCTKGGNLLFSGSEWKTEPSLALVSGSKQKLKALHESLIEKVKEFQLTEDICYFYSGDAWYAFSVLFLLVLLVLGCLLLSLRFRPRSLGCSIFWPSILCVESCVLLAGKFFPQSG